MSLADPADFPAAFAAAWHSRDGAAIGALFAEDADFVNVVGLWWRRRADISRAHDYALKSFFADTRLRVGAVSVRWLGADHAVVHSRLHLTGQRTPEGAGAKDRQTVMSFVLERRSTGWCAVSAQNTDVVPGAETHLNADGFGPADYRPH
ncbi:SgcJ/EcaC family oxidoreductase [Puniceibacterium confluentis]|uniref:SgcJ/EcaC family oxidoreductase n=1 Tax=Puniceibacterium confluentis TaxID=1958944 RepID=UPI0011B53477|nr:SgcJ/EcaC family oxidoreductase [Puniceibacterium confluentis]